ncbi:hypothetical protein M2160_008639 [Streptomyces sp. SAI-117]|uniref:hypothetical protein n=1 Tax=Streptomyces sp. SAI-117 TaxID=2940546 RepID=UPI002476A32C|nr:hypothetical protein [Streptomyces sp. SAI-117]MDH6573532.1 hypothetical protein [Streptomyces sp. SAI-117]
MPIAPRVHWWKLEASGAAVVDVDGDVTSAWNEISAGKGEPSAEGQTVPRIVMSGAVVVMLLLTPRVIRLRVTSWTVGWLATLLGSIAVMALVGLTARLTVTDGRPTRVDELES